MYFVNFCRELASLVFIEIEGRKNVSLFKYPSPFFFHEKSITFIISFILGKLMFRK